MLKDQTSSRFESRRSRRIAQWAALVALAVGGCAAVPGAGPDSQTDMDAGRQRMGNLVVQGVPDIPPSLSERLRQYQNTRSALFRGATDRGLVMTTRFGETEQIHLLRTPLGAREQVTFYEEPIGEVAVPPGSDQSGFVYARDAGGSEFYQLFWYDWRSRSSTLLTDGKSRYSTVVWSRDGARFAYTTTERDGRHWDIHAQDRAGNKQVLFESESGAWATLDWSPAGDRLLILNYLSINDSDLYELDVATGGLTPLADPELMAAVGDARYGPDGRTVYFTSDMGAEFVRLHRLNLASGAIDVLTGDVPWDVEAIQLAPDGSKIAIVVNEGGYSTLSVRSLPDGSPLALPELPQGIIHSGGFSPGGDALYLTLHSPVFPGDIFEVDLEGRSLRRWTRSEVGGLDLDSFVAPEMISVPTFDSVDGRPRRVPAFVYRPSGPGPHPVVIYAHGGPEAQYRPNFSATVQFFVNELGVAFVAPNVRGSAGYGKSYLKLDNGRLREDSVKDLGAFLDWIDRTPELDSDRVAVMGGSYGGYMVLASMVHYADRLAAGVESVGISNFVTFLENTQDYRRDLRRAEYGDERDPEMRAFLESISPLNHVDAMTRPLMISQGYNDPRVPVSESEQIVAALSAADIPVWYVLAMDEGHGFRKKSNADYFAAARTLFLKKYLIREEAVDALDD